MPPEFDCDLVIPVWNQLNVTRRCLESLLRHTSEPVRLILVDNGSSKPTRDYLERFQAGPAMSVHLIQNPENLGFIQAVNQGVRAGSSRWICVLNNDTVVTEGWLTEMLKAASADPKIGLVNPTSNSLGFRPTGESLTSYAERIKAQSGTCSELSTALGFCLLARRSLWESVGGLDEAFGLGYFDDDDLSRKVKAAGYRCVRANASYVFHEERSSFRLLPRSRRAFERNRRLFEQRWGRRLRILCEELPAGAALPLAGDGHWLTFVGAPEKIPREIRSHSQVACLGLNGRGRRFRATVRLLLKRKKPFDLVVSQDPRWSGWIQRLRWFHRAKLLSAPSEKEILEQCHRLSRSPSL